MTLSSSEYLFMFKWNRAAILGPIFAKKKEIRKRKCQESNGQFLEKTFTVLYNTSVFGTGAVTVITRTLGVFN